MAVVRRIRWTESECDYIKANWGTVSPAEVAKHLGRRIEPLYQKAVQLGAARKYANKATLNHRIDVIQQKLKEGYSQTDIGTVLGIPRETVKWLMKKSGLKPSGNGHERQRRRIGERTQEQVKKAGVDSLAEVRSKAFRDFATKNGWPSDLRPRAVQILETLLAESFLTRQQLCEKLGMKWNGSRKSLCSNDKEGSYLGNLAARGLVGSSPKVLHAGARGRRRGSGCGVQYYFATNNARRLKAEFLKGKDSHSNGNVIIGG